MTAIPLLFIWCTSNLMTINSSYRNVNLENRSLVIYFIPNTLYVKNASLVKKHFGEGDSLKVYGDFVRSQMPLSLKKVTKFKSITCVDSMQNFHLNNTKLTTSKNDSFSIMLPESGSKLEFNAEMPDIVLFVQDLTSETDQILHYNRQGGYSSPVLVQKANCAFWDNVTGGIISYGKVKSEAKNFFPTLTKGLWVEGLDLFALNLVKPGPFYYNTNNIQ